MHLTAYQSGKGDCLLLSNAADTHRVLVDGGMPDAYSAHVAPALGRLRELRKKIDLVYISHIDEDHIGGILQLLDDEVAWRVHAHQIAHGNPGHRPPDAPRPPEILADRKCPGRRRTRAVWRRHRQAERSRSGTG
jgi:glyoxylase-like metal-dependent hydrolase (beta-lactamase superfamily II)